MHTVNCYNAQVNITTKKSENWRLVETGCSWELQKGYRSALRAEFSRTCYADRPIFSLSKSHYSDRNDFNLHASYRNWRVVILHQSYCLLRETAGLLLADY